MLGTTENRYAEWGGFTEKCELVGLSIVRRIGITLGLSTLEIETTSHASKLFCKQAVSSFFFSRP